MQKRLWEKGFKVFLHPKRIMNKILQVLARSHLMHPRLRVSIQQLRGVKFRDPKSVFIGANVYFDELRPEQITIGRNVYLTEGVKVLTHFYDASRLGHIMNNGFVVIEDGVFMGFNSMIVSPVTIGRNSVVGANSVITKNIEESSIVGGVPARVIKKREIT